MKGKQEAWCSRYKASIWWSSPRILSHTRLYPLAPRIWPRMLSALKANISSSHTLSSHTTPPTSPLQTLAICHLPCDVWCAVLHRDKAGEMGPGQSACCTVMRTWELIPSMHIYTVHGNVHLVIPALEDRGGRISETCCPVSLAESVSSR